MPCVSSRGGRGHGRARAPPRRRGAPRARGSRSASPLSFSRARPATEGGSSGTVRNNTIKHRSSGCLLQAPYRSPETILRAQSSSSAKSLSLPPCASSSTSARSSSTSSSQCFALLVLWPSM